MTKNVSVFSKYQAIKAQIKTLQEVEKKLRDAIIKAISEHGKEDGKAVRLQADGVEWCLTPVVTTKYNQTCGCNKLDKAIRSTRDKSRRQELEQLYIRQIDIKRYVALKTVGGIPHYVREAFEDTKVSERLTFSTPKKDKTNV